MRRLLRGALVIARRDFIATVFSKSFLLFLLAPLFPVAVMLVFGSLTVNAARQVERPVVAVIGETQDFAALSAARERIAAAFSQASLVRLVHSQPEPDRAEQRRRLLESEDPPVLAVLEGGLEHPRLTGDIGSDGSTARQLALLVEQARRLEAAPEPQGLPLVVAPAQRSSGSLASARMITAQAGQAILFVLTILLATMLLSQLIEEKSNKIIEVLAAAVPVGSIFLGKLLAMLSVSLLGIAVWTGAAASAIAAFTDGGLATLPPPALGWPVFIALGIIYFAMSYLLIGAIFLGIGGHASSAREVQTLSMPVTMAQIVVFAIAALAISEPNGPAGLAAAAFPLSSPYVMIARAAQFAELWPHLVAILWQILWVGLILALAARLFRRSVLKSGPSRQRRRTARA